MSLPQIVIDYAWGGLFGVISIGLGLVYKRWLDKREGYRW